MSLLSAESVSKDFAVESGFFRRKSGAVRAVAGASLSLERGASLGLVGESGSGKTTLGRLLCGLLEPTEGRVLWEGAPLASMPPRRRALRVQMIFQDPSASLNPKHSVETILLEPLRVRAEADGARPSAAGLRAAARELLETVGLPPDILFYYPHQFSGGQKQRLAIARAVAVRPEVIVADEPVSALDLSIQAQILNLLMDLKERYKLTTVVISHDLTVVSHLADRVAVMKDGAIVETGPASAVLERPSHPYTRALVDAVPAMFR